MRHTVITSLILMMVLACSIGRQEPEAASGEGPAVAISSPLTDQVLTPDQPIQVRSTSVDAQGIARVELIVNNQVVQEDTNPNPQPNTPYIVAQSWQPEMAGAYVIQARAYNTTDMNALSDPVTVRVMAETPTAEIATLPTNTPISLLPTITPPPPLPTILPETPTPLPDTPTPLPPTPPPLDLPTPTATPTPGVFEPTGLQPDGRFKDVWLELGGGDSRLGYPTTPEIDDRNFARQYFANGLMFWWDSPQGANRIWVIDSPHPGLNRGDSWNAYPDTWQGDESYFCDAALANGDKGPVRGFGKLWCERPELQERLGNPRENEAGSGGRPPFAHVQLFQGGVMISNPLNNELFVLFNQGDWRRFAWN